MKRTVLDLLKDRTDISSIKEELVPWLCRIQYRTASRRKWGEILSPQRSAQTLALMHSSVRVYLQNENEDGEGIKSPKSPAALASAPPSQPSSPKGFSYRKKLGSAVLEKAPEVRCGFVVHRYADGRALRTNTLKSYFDANRLVRDKIPCSLLKNKTLMGVVVHSHSKRVITLQHTILRCRPIFLQTT